jgi:hypothetical protein
MVAAVMLALALVGSGGSDCTNSDERATTFPVNRAPTEIVLQIVRTTPVEDDLLETMIEEAAAIWTPYHVVVSPVLTTARPQEARGRWITLIFRNEPANQRSGGAPGGRRAIASLVFVGDTPGDVMYVSFETALQTVGNTPFAKGTASVQQRLVARLLGRAVAHELGHYLLASKRHSKDGLMRASFDWRDATWNAPGQFRLSPDQAALVTDAPSHDLATSLPGTDAARPLPVVPSDACPLSSP